MLYIGTVLSLVTVSSLNARVESFQVFCTYFHKQINEYTNVKIFIISHFG